MGRKRSLAYLFFLIILLASIGYSVPKVKLWNVREIVEYPLPSLPEIVVWSGNLLIKVNASESARNWEAWLVSEHGSYELELVSSSYEEGLWNLYFKVPTGIPPILYDLKIRFYDGEQKEHLQPRSISVLKEWPDELEIAHITDIHLPGGAQVYAQCIYELNLIRPHLVIATGDIVDVDTIKSAWQYYFFLSEYWKAPIYLVPGNHDHAGDDAVNFQKFAAPLYWYTRIGPYLIVALDTASDGYVTKEQLEWADKIFSENPDAVKILAFHHPIFNYPGGEVEVNLNNVSSVKDKMYSSWAERLEEAAILLNLIAKHDVRLILSGHIHADTVAVMNGRYYFFVKEPSGGSVREGSHYQSYRILCMTKDGEIEAIMHEGKDLFEYPNSLPVGNLIYYYTPVNDGSSSAVSLRVDNGLNADIPIVAEFKVKAGEEYRIYGVENVETEFYEVEGGILYFIKTTIPAGEKLKITLAAVDDKSPPKIESIELKKDSKQVTIKTSDVGWGVADVIVEVSVNGSEWRKVEAKPLILVDKDKGIIDTYEAPMFVVDVPSSGTIKLKVTAVDFAGNAGEEVTKVFELVEEKPPAEKPEQPSPQPILIQIVLIIVVVALLAALIIFKKRRS